MIQRIQSLFLLVVVFLTGLMFLFDFSNFEKGVETSGFNVCGIENVCTTWPLAILNFLILAIALYTIFAYKNRILQMRICTLNAILMIGQYALMAFYMYYMKDEGTKLNFELPILIPFINIILTYISWRAIGKDEALVHSYDHLR
ncbi:MAG: DUF4293 domain-containing protein [Paludibacteraceae bacterium]|nr:DUF4293 domain-containing protein [Paludibacteraceae bacterium]